MIREEDIKYENKLGYVFKVGRGHYEVRKHMNGYSIVVGDFHNTDEPEDELERAIEFCDDLDQWYPLYLQYHGLA